MEQTQQISRIFENNGIKIRDVKYISAGSYGKVYKCVDTNDNLYAFKVYFKSNVAEMEAMSLEKLSSCSKINIPRVYFYGNCDKQGFEYLCMEFINGKNALVNAKLLFAPKRVKNEFADIVTDALLDIHSITSEKFGNFDNPLCDKWLDYYKPFAQNLYQQALEKNKENKFDSYILNTMTQALDAFDEIFCEDVSEASLIHGDLNVMNIMVDSNLKPIAFIDPLNSMYADREYDLFQLKNLTGNVFNLYDTYKKKYPVSANCDAKCAFYSLFNEAMVYLQTGRYTKFIMNMSVNNMKKQLRKK
jgi:fructosamine-3-kinase